jgi:hypothetical protein
MEINSRCLRAGDHAYQEASRRYAIEWYAQGRLQYTAGGVSAIMDGDSLEAIEGKANLNYKVKQDKVFTK